MLTAGTMVKGGYYFNRDGLDLIAISGKEGALPGDAGQRYVRVPAWAALLLAPLAGGIFAMAMPIIGLLVVLHHLGRTILRKSKDKRRPPSSGTSDEAQPKG